MRCEACGKYKQRICGLKNFPRARVEGSSNHNMSNIVDHATSHQHKAAVLRLRSDQAKGRNDPYSPIARNLLSMDSTVRERMKNSILALVLAKESMPFRVLPRPVSVVVHHATSSMSYERWQPWVRVLAMPA